MIQAKQKRAGRRPVSKDDLTTDLVVYGLCLLVLLLVAYPMVYVISCSFSNPDAVIRGEVTLLPRGLTLDGYKQIVDYKPIWTGYRNTIFYTVTATALNLLVTVPCAYALSRRELWGRKQFMALFTFTMFFSGGMIPHYLLMKDLRLLNTVWAMIIPGAVSTYNMIITRTFFENSIPPEVQEAAIIDGCGNSRLFFSVVLPLSKPIIAVLILFYGVGHWNAYFNAMIYLSDAELYPLQLILRNILLLGEMNDMMGLDAESQRMLIYLMRLKEVMKYGIIVLASLPMMILYPFLQKYFVQGVMVGAIKG